MEKRYCRKCGTRLIDKMTKFFNEENGSVVLAKACPKLGCENHCDAYGHEWVRYSWWNSNMECKLCGYREPDYF